MAKNEKKLKGAEGFEQHYSALFKDRWPSLKQALLSLAKKTVTLDYLDPTYGLDEGSVVVAKALKVQKEMAVLDLCSAPGGKAMVLAQELAGTGSLTVNELSKPRFFRLKRNLETLHPPYQNNLTFTKYDASRYSFFCNQQFDAILLDAPCSSEEHLMHNNTEMTKWSLGRSKRLAITQVAILCQALHLCKQGGAIVYATCALNPQENDGVIATLFKKRKGQFQIDEDFLNNPSFIGEKTRYGFHILPDKTAMGPLYYSRLIKKAHGGV